MDDFGELLSIADGSILLDIFALSSKGDIIRILLKEFSNSDGNEGKFTKKKKPGIEKSK